MWERDPDLTSQLIFTLGDVALGRDALEAAWKASFKDSIKDSVSDDSVSDSD